MTRVSSLQTFSARKALRARYLLVKLRVHLLMKTRDAQSLTTYVTAETVDIAELFEYAVLDQGVGSVLLYY
ncbi:hypothetical protein GOP47_0027462 [Adiantum capillus-veneris]|nr:hypothetical protein GOP47_0027462 [Adiantum capillus-veneris]